MGQELKIDFIVNDEYIFNPREKCTGRLGNAEIQIIGVIVENRI